jgi:hypothetical protein
MEQGASVALFFRLTCERQFRNLVVGTVTTFCTGNDRSLDTGR